MSFLLSSFSRPLFCGSLALSMAFAHHTWIAPAMGVLEVGKAAVIRICHGHEFPAGEEKISIANGEAYVLTPSGKRVKLEPVVNKGEVTAALTPGEAGFHRLVFSQDRGVSSRTPAGVKPGGRDKNPTATQASRTYRSAVAYLVAGKGAEAPTPVGVEVELTGKPGQGSWELQLRRGGKPEPNVQVQAFLAGAQDATAIGNTDAAGKIRYRVPNGNAKPILFTAEWKANSAPGAAYDSTNYYTSLYVAH